MPRRSSVNSPVSLMMGFGLANLAGRSERPNRQRLVAGVDRSAPVARSRPVWCKLMNVVVAVVVGVLTGLHAATWGAYKDSPFEGFRPRSFVRSILVGAIASIAFGGWQTRHGAESTSIMVWVGVAYALERLATEWWKSFVRIDDQSAYTIPMRIAVGGNPIDRWSTRSVVGVGVIAAVAAAGVGIGLLHDAFPHTPAWLVIVAIGGLGWLGDGGRWGLEGCADRGVQRLEVSPKPGGRHGLGGSDVLGDRPLVPGRAGGRRPLRGQHRDLQVVLHRWQTSGKFGSKPKLHHLPVASRRLGQLHALLWAVLGLAVLDGLSETPGGISVRFLSSLNPQLPLILLASIAVAASVLAVLVVGRIESLGQSRLPVELVVR